MKSLQTTMKKNLLLIAAFVLTILFGAWLSESIKVYKADLEGYSARYVYGLGRHVFYNDSLGEAYDKVYEQTGSYEAAKELQEWKELAKQDYKGHAQFETFTMAIMWIIAIIGFALLLVLLKKSTVMRVQHYFAFFISLFFMRYVVLAAVNLFLAYPCGEAKVLWHYGFDAHLFQSIVLICGILFLGLIVLKLPKNERLQIIITGAIGSVLGLVLWFFWLGPLLFK